MLGSLEPVEELCSPDDGGSLSQGVNLSVVEKMEQERDKGRKTEMGKKKGKETGQREDTTSLESQLQSAIVVQMVPCNCTSAS